MGFMKGSDKVLLRYMRWDAQNVRDLGDDGITSGMSHNDGTRGER